jgi:Cu/Ag efflux pump CusA
MESKNPKFISLHSSVFHAIRDGAVLVLIVLFLFLLNFRTTFIAALAIPLSLLITAIVMRLANITINPMTLSVNTAPGTSLQESDKIGDMVDTILSARLFFS